MKDLKWWNSPLFIVATFGLSFLFTNNLSAQCAATGSEKIISGTVFNDINANTNNDSESGIQGVDVRIYHDVNQDGLVDAGDILLSTETTDVNGNYNYTYTGSALIIEDDFSGSVFSGTNNNSGTTNWANDAWIKSGVNGNATDVIKLTTASDGDMHLAVPLLQLKDQSAGAYRLVDLSSATAATLSFDYDNDDSSMNGNERLRIQIDPENDGSYVTLQNITATGNEVNPPITVSINIPAAQLGGANTRIRIITHSNNGQNGNNDEWWIDDVRLSVSASIDDFVIETDASTYPVSYALTTDNIETATIASSGNCDNNNDFGLALSSCLATGSQKIISGSIYDDININGSNDTESGIQNVDVNIYQDVNKNGLVDASDILLSTEATDVNGYYSYTYNVAPTTISATDNFSSGNYSSGTGAWASNWIETDDTNLGPSAEYIEISGGELHFNWIYANYETITRSVNLNGTLDATLTFDWNGSGLSSNRRFAFLASSDGINFFTLGILTGGTSGSISADLSSYISTTTSIRFQAVDSNWESSDHAYIDNVNISATSEVSYFLTETDVSTYPSGFIASTDNVETAYIASGGNCDEYNDFGLYYFDNDDDGLTNLDDLDDDNDGILDVDEGMSIFSGSYGTILADDADAIFEITPNTNAAQLVTYLFAPNSDVVVSGETINIGDGSVQQIGTFDDADQITTSGGATQAFSSFSTGLIFSTGNVESFDDNLSNQEYDPTAMGEGASGQGGGGTDPDFDTGFGEDDVSSLSFTANVSTVSTITGQFVFASDEYIDFIGAAYEDNIRIFVNGINQAISPNGAIVSINSINNSSQSTYFVDNESDPTAVNIEADGFTTVLTFSATLNIGDNTIKIGIADMGDNTFDSWLLFEANSFQVISQNVTGVDTDGDLIFDHLDNDSDDDNCPDAREAADNIVASQVNGLGQIIGGQDSNGVPSLVLGGQSTTPEVTNALLSNKCGCKQVRTNFHISKTIEGF